jgi:hypothetical protein
MVIRIDRWPRRAAIASRLMPRLKLGEACVAQLVAGRPVQPGTAPGPFQDLIQPGRRQRLAATGALQHHEHLPGRSRCGPFGLQVGLRTALVISARDPSAAQAPSAGAPGDRSAPASQPFNPATTGPVTCGRTSKAR